MTLNTRKEIHDKLKGRKEVLTKTTLTSKMPLKEKEALFSNFLDGFMPDQTSNEKKTFLI